MQDVAPPIDQHRVAVQRHPRQSPPPPSRTRLAAAPVQRRRPLGKRPRPEQVGRIDLPIRRARPRRQVVIHDHPPALERPQLRLPLAVRDEVDQVQLPQRRLRRRVHRHRRQPVRPIAQLAHASTNVAPFSRVESDSPATRLRMDRQQVARHARRREHALQARHHQPLIRARPVIRHQVHDRLHRIVARDHLRQVIHAPHLRIVLDARDVLVAGDLVHRSATPNRSGAAASPSGPSRTASSPRARRPAASASNSGACSTMPHCPNALSSAVRSIAYFSNSVGTMMSATAVFAITHPFPFPVPRNAFLRVPIRLTRHFTPPPSSRAARPGSLFSSLICSVRFHVSFRNGFFTDRFARPPGPAGSCRQPRHRRWIRTNEERRTPARPPTPPESWA